MSALSTAVSLALTDNGYNDGTGYPGRNDKACVYVGRPNEYSCADTVTMWLDKAGLVLPVVQPGKGAGYVPYLTNLGRQRGALRAGSWLAQPGDVVIFLWGATDDGGDHVGLVERWDADNGVLWTVEGDSGPSNVDGFRGEGGVHRHTWTCPAGVGNDQILCVIDTTLITTPAATFHAASTPATPHVQEDDSMSAADVATIAAKIDTDLGALRSDFQTALTAVAGAARSTGTGWWLGKVTGDTSGAVYRLRGTGAEAEAYWLATTDEAQQWRVRFGAELPITAADLAAHIRKGPQPAVAA